MGFSFVVPAACALGYPVSPSRLLVKSSWPDVMCSGAETGVNGVFVFPMRGYGEGRTG